MQEIRTAVEIAAPPSAVWAELANLQAYPEWNPHIICASGDLRERKRLTIAAHREDETDREMTVTVTELEPERRLQWVGKVGGGVLFEGHHTFELEPLEDDRTRFVNREEASGLLVRFVVSDDPEQDYEAMNRALKERVEGAAAGVPDGTVTERPTSDSAASRGQLSIRRMNAEQQNANSCRPGCSIGTDRLVSRYLVRNLRALALT